MIDLQPLWRQTPPTRLLARALPAALSAALAVVAVADAAARQPAATPPRVQLAEVRPGQTGYGLTVFSGSSPDTFGVTVLGVQWGARAGGDVILVELSGHDLALTAVARGMSGSPVYLDDGRLLGAVAFGWPGALRAIAGLTPASELDDVLDRPLASHARAAGQADRWHGLGALESAAALLLAGEDGGLAASLLADVGIGAPPAPRGHGPQPRGVWPTAQELAGRLLAPPRPIDAAPAPLAAGDSRLTPLDLALYVVPAGVPAAAVRTEEAAGSSAIAPADLVAGSACAVSLVAGDGQLGAMGTVSLVEGKRVVVMAHPFLQLGPVDLPLATASVVTLFPSRELSFKLGSAGAHVGRITHDLRAGLAGVLGERAPTVPVAVTVAMPDRRRDFAFEVALQPELTPQLVFWCLYNALLAEGDDRSLQLVHFDIALALAGAGGRALPAVHLRGATGGPGGVNALQSDWQAPLQMLLGNRHEPLTLTGVQAELRIEKPLRLARIVALHAPARIAPGEVFTLEVELAERHGPRRRERFALRAPDNLQPGFLRLGAASARDFFRLDALRASGLFEDHSLEATLDLLNRPRSLAELTVALIGAEPGFTAAGRELSGLPSSVRRTLAAGPPGATRPTMAGYLLRETRPIGVLLQGDAVRDIEVRLPAAPRTEGVRP